MVNGRWVPPHPRTRGKHLKRPCSECLMREAPATGGVCATCRHQQESNRQGRTEMMLPLRLGIMLSWAKVLHPRLAEHCPVPPDLDAAIINRINDAVCNTKLAGETFAEFYKFHGRWNGRLPRSRGV
jgi:hypothetical protein